MSSERITAKAFHDAGGVDDWRVLYWGAHAYFTTDSFAEGARFVALIAEEAEAVEHFPDVDLRPQGVTVRTFTRENGALSEQDIDLARRISRIAADLRLGFDPSQVQAVGIAIAQNAGADMRPFFSAVFGYANLGDEDAVDTHRRNPHLWFHELDPPSLDEAVSTLMSQFQPTRPRLGSQLPLPQEGGSPTTRTCPGGGHLLPLRTTAWTSRLGPTSRTTKIDDHGPGIGSGLRRHRRFKSSSLFRVTTSGSTSRCEPHGPWLTRGCNYFTVVMSQWPGSRAINWPGSRMAGARCASF